jgi:DnaJ-class molecular chaperone
MHHVYSPTVLLSLNVNCSKCDWQGKGTDVNQEELILTHAIELYCPACNGYMGFISETDHDE